MGLLTGTGGEKKRSLSNALRNEKFYSNRVLICSSETFPPQCYGGAQNSVQQFCIGLKERGYHPTLFCTFSSKGVFGFERRLRRKVLNRKFVKDYFSGFETYRSWNVIDHAEAIIQQVCPDIVIADVGETNRIAKRFVQLGLPTLASIRGVEFHTLGGQFFQNIKLHYISNSIFTQKILSQKFGIESTILYPIVEPAKYQTVSSGKYVLHVNPLPVKGIDTTFSLAKLRPDIDFLIIESWPISKRKRELLRKNCRELPNVQFAKPVSDMRTIYAGARCVLVPSVWEEAWGRVVSEAHISGIPVLASELGGLPESVGPGGVLINPNAPIDEWLQGLSELWDNPDYYQKMSKAAFEYSRREELKPNNIIDNLVNIIESHMQASSQ